MIKFSWNIHHKCNYRCPYCWFNGSWDGAAAAKNDVYPGLERLKEVWNSVYAKYGRTHIMIAGGEPFLYPDFTRLVACLLADHKVSITTNLSGDVGSFTDSVRGVGELDISMSFHPHSAEPDEFAKKALVIKNAGIRSSVLLLAWPPMLQQIMEYKRRFERAGLFVMMMTYWGKYDGKMYPEAYSSAEKELLAPHIGSLGEKGPKFQLSPQSVKGRMCRAGQVYASIHPNGDVYRCGGGGWGIEHSPFTNLFSEDFALLRSPQPCLADYCPVNEWAHLT